LHPHSTTHTQLTDALDEAQRRCHAELPPWQWFDRKVRGHMDARSGLPSQRVPSDSVGDVLAESMRHPSARPRTIYVHVPFCTRICSFCAFFRQPKGISDLQAYTEAVANQIEQMSVTRWAQEGPSFTAVYFGGGTPTALESAQLAGLVSAIRNNYRLARDCEFTVECRFDGLDADYLKRLRDAGVTRLSFGVQSFDTTVRRGVGRIADRNQVLDTIKTASRLGFEQISLDLIYNLPGQSIESWTDDIRTLVDTSATASSIYALIPMKGRALVKQIEAGRRKPIGDCEREHEMFTHAHDELMRRLDWRRFSFHHFGDHRSERSVYNRVRMGTMDTLALGCGAGGQVGNLSYMNAMTVEQFVEAFTGDGDASMMAFEQPHALSDLFEAYRLAETEGIDRTNLLELLPNADEWIDRLIALGLLQERHNWLTLTCNGCFWGYNVTTMITELILAHWPADRTAKSKTVTVPVIPQSQGVATCSSSSID